MEHYELGEPEHIRWERKGREDEGGSMFKTLVEWNKWNRMLKPVCEKMNKINLGDGISNPCV